MKVALFTERHNHVGAKKGQPAEYEDEDDDGDRLGSSLLLGHAYLLAVKKNGIYMGTSQ